TLILGLGFRSIPKLRRSGAFGLLAPWTCWALWTSGVSLRWVAAVYAWQWRLLLPASAVLELVAFLIFFRSVSGHRGSEGSQSKFEKWIVPVLAGSVGFLVSLLINLGAVCFLAFRAASPELPHRFHQTFRLRQPYGSLHRF